jgi:hypothetical protein
VGRGIRAGLRRCTVCGSATDAGQVCPGCADALERGDVDALRARSLEYLSGRFAAVVRKDVEFVTRAIERRFAGATPG